MAKRGGRRACVSTSVGRAGNGRLIFFLPIFQLSFLYIRDKAVYDVALNNCRGVID